MVLVLYYDCKKILIIRPSYTLCGNNSIKKNKYNGTRKIIMFSGGYTLEIMYLFPPAPRAQFFGGSVKTIPRAQN